LSTCGRYWEWLSDGQQLVASVAQHRLHRRPARITGELLAVPEAVRTSTVISLLEEMPLCVCALLEEAAKGCRPTRLAFARSHGGSW
jgi:hypothetical protein